MLPYFYLIQHKKTGKLYAGSQYGKNSDPNNLLKTYFTSSKYVREMLETDGKDSFFIIEIKVCENAREFEQKYLLKKYYDLGREEFLKTYINRNLSPGILLTEDIIRKANEKRKVSNSISAKKLLEEGKHNFQLKPAENYVHVIQKRSERMMGNKLGSLRKIDDELRKKLSEKSKGNKNVRDTKWWNDGKQRKRSKDCPGENWKEGYKIN